MKLTGEVQRIGLNNYALEKVIETKNKKVQKKEQEIKDLQEKNEKLKEKIEKQDAKENEQRGNLKKLGEDIALKEKAIENQRMNQEKVKG